LLDAPGAVLKRVIVPLSRPAKAAVSTREFGANLHVCTLPLSS
jgi:hypothetical protein